MVAHGVVVLSEICEDQVLSLGIKIGQDQHGMREAFFGARSWQDSIKADIVSLLTIKRHIAESHCPCLQRKLQIVQNMFRQGPLVPSLGIWVR